MRSFGMSMLWFWVCYLLVTAVGILHTVFNIYVLHMQPMDENYMGEASEKTALASAVQHPSVHVLRMALSERTDRPDGNGRNPDRRDLGRDLHCL